MQFSLGPLRVGAEWAPVGREDFLEEGGLTLGPKGWRHPRWKEL